MGFFMKNLSGFNFFDFKTKYYFLMLQFHVIFKSNYCVLVPFGKIGFIQ